MTLIWAFESAESSILALLFVLNLTLAVTLSLFLVLSLAALPLFRKCCCGTCNVRKM